MVGWAECHERSRPNHQCSFREEYKGFRLIDTILIVNGAVTGAAMLFIILSNIIGH